jgi:hypothetical protein
MRDRRKNIQPTEEQMPQKKIKKNRRRGKRLE